MTSDAAAPAPDLLHLPVRRLGLTDLEACSDLASSRGWGREEHKWRLLLTAGHGYGVDAPDRPGALIGAYVLTCYDALPGGRPYSSVGMVLVAERFARRGLGQRLMQHALSTSGEAAVFLSATPGGRPLYEKLGFRPVGSSLMLTGHFIPAPHDPDVTGRAATTVRTATPTDLPPVRALDATAFGADRSELLTRLPHFADRFVVAERAGALTGFAAAWPNDTTTVIGPLIADTLPTAQALVTDLARHASGTLRFDLDERHTALGHWLRAHGLAGDSRCTLMTHSAPDLPGDATRRFAPYSVALG